MANGKTTKTLVWILMGMLIVGLGGFGATNLGGTIRTVGSVGEKDIDINAYSRALQDELRGLEAQAGQSISFAQAQAFGVDRTVLGRLVTTRALDGETQRLGLSIGDENLRREILEIPAFNGVDGTFDREAYRFAMEQAGLNESEFENSVREESARTLLQSAVVTGIVMPKSFVETLLTYVAEERSFTWARLQADDLNSPIAEATDANVQTYYDANIADFTRPATKQITYVSLTPDMLIDTVEVDEDALRALYDDRTATYNIPERRLVERLVFADMAQAQAARARLNQGEASFEQLVADRGLEMSDIDLGDVTAKDLGVSAADVFAVTAGALAGPVQSDLGPALFRVNGILPAQNTSFEDARTDLREELAAERARRVIDAQIGDIDDLLAAGATLEELAKETDMQMATIDWHPASEDPIAAYENFRAIASVVNDKDFASVETLEDGGIFALRLDGETNAAPAPLNDVRDAVIAGWTTQQTVAALKAQADALVSQLGAEVDFASLGLDATQENALTRTSFVEGTPQAMLQTIFEMSKGDVQTIGASDSVIIVKLTDILAPSTDTPETIALSASVSQQISSALSQDIFEAYAGVIQSQAGVVLNQQALNAVHAQFQ